MKTTVHIISHSHWDREWYQSFEKHRMKLIELVDNILEKAENDPEFGGFFLDGQTIALDDYLEVRPEKREQVEKCVREGKIQTGPWYILQDEFLTSGEACVRNLQVGMQEAARYGAIGNVGYFPDAFGNAGQMPQVLKQAGMDAVVFGRGVKPIGPNNEVTGGQYESTYSEMMWASPDGTKLPGILFANWYNNGVEVPVDEAEAKVYWDKKLADARRFAATHQLLMMNGCDHQPLQKDITEAIRVARKLYPDIEFIHSDFKTYVKAMEKEISENFSTVKGELTSQETDGRWTLANTASSWMGLKELFKGSRKEKGFAQTRPLQEILKDLVQEDASVTVSENGVNVILQGYMKDNTCWMHKLQYLPKYAKGGAYNKEGCYYELEYRLCEENISFRQSKDAEILFKVDLSKASLSETPDGILNEIISRGTGKFDPFFVMGFFRGTSGTDYSYGNHESDSLSVWANAFPVTRLKVRYGMIPVTCMVPGY